MSSLSRAESFRFIPSEGPSLAASATTENTNRVEIVIRDVAKKIIPSISLAITNSFLTIMVGVSKLTGFAILPSFAIGQATKRLHEANIKFARHAFTPLSDWAIMLGKENKRIIETDKVIEISKEKITFYPDSYKKQALDSLRFAMVPVSVGLSAAIAVVWMISKPIYFIMGSTILPESIQKAPLALNRVVGRLTYSPLTYLSERMYQTQMQSFKPIHQRVFYKNYSNAY